MAVPPYVTSGDVIEETWGDQVADSLVNPFGNAAVRSAAITSPANGMVSAITAANATNGLEVHNGVSWRKPWNMPWGSQAYAVTNNTRQTITAAGTDITGLSVTFDQVDNRLLRITLMLGVLGVTAGAVAYNLNISTGTSGAGTNVATLGESKLSLTEYSVMTYARIYTTTTTTASQSYHVRVASLSANGIAITNDLGLGNLIIEDIGPGGPPV